ncbi:MAG: hypothetical protein ILA26_07445, partial [Methanobrevibacter sp.]|uniref:hypothetical protein n=1 Tax=Methanobrevibacter sp. TaxID=66852 RepID=UPI001B4F88E2
INIKNEGLRLIQEKIIKTSPYWDCHGLRCAGIGSKILTFHSKNMLKKSRIPNFLKVGGSSTFHHINVSKQLI